MLGRWPGLPHYASLKTRGARIQARNRVMKSRPFRAELGFWGVVFPGRCPGLSPIAPLGRGWFGRLLCAPGVVACTRTRQDEMGAPRARCWPQCGRVERVRQRAPAPQRGAL